MRMWEDFKFVRIIIIKLNCWEEWIWILPEFLLRRVCWFCCFPCTWLATRTITNNNFKTCFLHISRVIFERYFYNIWQGEKNWRLSLSQEIFLTHSFPTLSGSLLYWHFCRCRFSWWKAHISLQSVLLYAFFPLHWCAIISSCSSLFFFLI